ncbi:MAG: large conductance mechanosensitive channel protein MscL [Chloroflexota bacterium]|nr:large conductance mechanosensitive channel protein MscL [Chloroflexota bacterium]
MIKGFKEFILRGNVVDLAVAVVMGAAFGAVVTSFVEDVMTPLIGAMGGQPDFSAVMLGPIQIGDFINAVLSFLILAAVVYFLIVAPVNRLMERFKPSPPAAAATRACPECLSDIPAAARRCAFCTAEVEPASADRVRTT